MDFLSLLSELLILFSPDGSSEKREKNSWLKKLSIVLLLIGLFGLLFEIKNIILLNNPVVFVLFAALGGILASVMLSVVLFKLRIIHSFKPGEFIFLVLVIALNFVIFLSLFNRNSDFILMGTTGV